MYCIAGNYRGRKLSWNAKIYHSIRGGYGVPKFRGENLKFVGDRAEVYVLEPQFRRELARRISVVSASQRKKTKLHNSYSPHAC